MISLFAQVVVLPCDLYAVFLLSLLVYVVAWVIYTRYFHPLAKYPGPFFASVSRLWLVAQVKNANLDKTQRRLHEKYGTAPSVSTGRASIEDDFRTLRAGSPQ